MSFAGAWRLDKTHTTGDEGAFLAMIGRSWFECKWAEQCEERQTIALSPTTFTLHSTLELHLFLCPSIDFSYETKLRTNGIRETQPNDAKGFGRECWSETTIQKNDARVVVAVTSKWCFARKTDGRRIILTSKRTLSSPPTTNYYTLELEAHLEHSPTTTSKSIRKRYVRTLL
jgi:hypothetical protein